MTDVESAACEGTAGQTKAEQIRARKVALYTRGLLSD